MITAGAPERARPVVLRALTCPGETVVIDHPSYPHAIDAVLRAHLNPAPVAMTPGRLDVEGLVATIRRLRPRLTYLIAAPPATPPAMGWPPATRRPWPTPCGRLGGLLVLDDTLRDLWFDRLPAAARRPRSRTGIRLGSTSKLYWGGLRVGWLKLTPRSPRPSLRPAVAATWARR